MEEAVCAGRYGFVAINAAGAYYADGRLGRFHHSRLHRRGVRAEEHIGITADKECVLHIACRMVGGEVQRREHMPFVFYLRTFGYRETEAAEYVDYLFADYRQWMARAKFRRRGGARQVEVAYCAVGVLKRFAQRVDFVGGKVFELVEGLAECFFLIGWHRAKVVEKRRNFAFLREIFDTQGLDFVGRRCRKRLYL